MGRGGVRQTRGARRRSSGVRSGRRRVVDVEPPTTEESGWLRLALGWPSQRRQLELRLEDNLAQGGRGRTSDTVASGLGGGTTLVARQRSGGKSTW
jgi:hypothetical protein